MNDVKGLAEAIRNGARFVVIRDDGVKACNTREEAGGIVSSHGGDAVALSVRDLTSGKYTPAAKVESTPYRKIGRPFSTAG